MSRTASAAIAHGMLKYQTNAAALLPVNVEKSIAHSIPVSLINTESVSILRRLANSTSKINNARLTRQVGGITKSTWYIKKRPTRQSM